MSLKCTQIRVAAFLAVTPLDLEPPEEVLHYRDVVAVPLPRHRLDPAVSFQDFAELLPLVLPALVGVEQRPFQHPFREFELCDIRDRLPV